MAGSERRNSVIVVFMGRNGMRGRVHREGLDGRGDGNEAWRTDNGGNGPPTVETGVLLIGRGVAYRKMDETDLCWSATVETGVLFIGRGVAYRKTGLHGILFISTIDPLQPPRATVHPTSTSSSLHLRLFIHGLLFIQPPPRATPPATVQPALSTGSCSTTPPRATVHPALHHLLFIPPSTGSCSSSPNRLDRSGSCSSTPLGTVHPNPPATLTVHLEAASIGFS